MKECFILCILITTLTGCVTEDVNHSRAETPNNHSPAETPKLATLPNAKWEGRNIYDFFVDVFERGVPAYSLTNQVFSVSPHKGVSWKIIQANRGMNVVGVDVPDFAYMEYSFDRESAIRRWKSKQPFPVDEATFVINRWSDVSYLDGQKFNQYVIFTGYEEGFVQYTPFATNEIKKLCFLTAQGWDDAVEYFQEMNY